MDVKEIWWKVVDWFHLAQDKHRRRNLLNAVVNLRVPQKAGKYLSIGKQLLASQEILCCVD